MDVTLYTRRDCHLCDLAKEILQAAGLAPREIDVDSDPALQRQYTHDVPVIFIGDREAFRHRVDPEELRRMIMSTALASEKCVPCRGGVPPLKGAELAAVLEDLGGGWRVVDGHHLEKEFRFRDFAEALAFTNAVGAIAEEQGHHPDLHLAWGNVCATIWTHKIDGLTRSDFVLAAKIDRAVDAFPART